MKDYLEFVELIEEDEQRTITGWCVDSLEDAIRLSILRARIALWMKGGDVSNEEARIYMRMLYRELKRIRTRNLKQAKSSES